ncbi:rhodanese-like domain-containing protein [Vitreoscilla stercoraria]|uniref:Sulfurtransferase n=1 Tax=Vitreoscilla stercoraria TaxID=61 RepID=A0ABY4EB44_VITST|nr:rhodanese-like domain-containing protein [Vitreoscilla stercoraria]UOO92563.1 sulfurtransferase [Vitreoscilla stercoraria]
MGVKSLSVQDLQAWRESGKALVLLDVREDNEVAYAHIQGHTHIPMNLVTLRHNELPDDLPIVVYCHHGMRSMQVAMFLEHAGFEDLYNLNGGIEAWSTQIDASVPRY